MDTDNTSHKFSAIAMLRVLMSWRPNYPWLKTDLICAEIQQVDNDSPNKVCYGFSQCSVSLIGLFLIESSEKNMGRWYDHFFVIASKYFIFDFHLQISYTYILRSNWDFKIGGANQMGLSKIPIWNLFSCQRRVLISNYIHTV
jgi:hypothetical protein